MAFRQKTESHKTRSITAEWLRELHQGNLDCARVFREAARVVSDESVAAICDDMSRARQGYAEELEEYLTAYESEDRASLATVVHRAWLDLRASFSSVNPTAVLAEVLRGQRRLGQGYNRAIAALSGSPVLGLIRRHTNEIASDTKRLAELHDAFADADDSNDDE